MGASPGHLVSEVAQVKSYSMGAYCNEFEKQVVKRMNVLGAVGVTSGSDAILISLLALGIKPGDKVMVQDRSWIAAANAIAILGAIPIFVDVMHDVPTLCISDLRQKYSPEVRALIIVHMNGRHKNLSEILNFCSSNGFPIIEDAAQAFGSRIGDKFLGTFGVIGCFSLSIAKIVGSGQGGFCVTNDLDLVDKLKSMRTHGTIDTFTASWKHIGFNFRLTDFHAAIATDQLSKLDQRIVRALEVQNFYELNLKDIKEIELIPVDFAAGEVGPYIEILVKSKKAELVEYLSGAGVEMRPFYPAISTATYLGGFGETPNANRFARLGLYLPSGPAITDLQIEFVTSKIAEFYKCHQVH